MPSRAPEFRSSEWNPDILDAFRTPESALKKQLRELIQAGNFHSHDQLNEVQIASLSHPVPEDDTDTEVDDD